MASKSIFVTVLFFGLILTSSISCTQAQPKTVLTAEDLISDLETLQYWIHEAHGDPYRYTSKEEIDQQFTASIQRIQENDGLILEEFFQETMKIMALLKDGHSQAFMPNLDQITGKVFFPVLIRFIDYKPMVLFDLSGSDIPVGSELISINSESAENMFAEFFNYVHGDGSIKLSRYRKMESNFYLTRLMTVFGKSSETYQIIVKTKEGEEKMFKVNALTQSQARSSISAYSSSRPKPSLFNLSMSSDVELAAVLKIGSFNTHHFQDDYQKYTNQVDAYFYEINSAGIENLILDLRDNTGGEDSYEAYLLRYLMSEPFKMYGQLTFRKDDYKFLPDGKHWDIPEAGFKANNQGSFDATEALWDAGESTLGIQQPLQNRYQGRLIVLINAHTFSAASGMASFLHHTERAIFVGEETGGSYIGSVAGYNPTFDLPNTLININLPLMNVRRPFFNEAWTDRGVLPDIRVEPEIQDIISGNDVVLEAALDYINEQS